MGRTGQIRHTSAHSLAQAIVDQTGSRIVLGLPLGLGKAVPIANALYEIVRDNAELSLKIITALTIARPTAHSDLERRFLDPIVARHFGDYAEPIYAPAVRAGALPANIEVHEFFLQAGAWLNSAIAQQSFLAANYTHVLHLMTQLGVNVVAQLVARDEPSPAPRYNLSCNPDLTLDLLKARQNGEMRFLMVGQLHSALPALRGAEISADELDHVLEGKTGEPSLPNLPRRPIDDVDYAMALHIASLIPDGGTIQIGIGSLGDAIAHCLIMRDRHSERFRALIAAIAPEHAIAARHTAPFEAGLFASTEMFAEALLELLRAGILKREVDGAVVHAGFFLPTRDFCAALNALDPAIREKLRMCPIGFVNDLYGVDIEARRRARSNARFVNDTMMATLLGAATSDALEDGRVVSGVGGQFNFVAQAFELPGARSILALRSSRSTRAKTSSNIRWSYGHTTIPNHLRDIFVTEYGVADLRGVSDAAAVASMLSITDSRFQEALLEQAKRAGKIDRAFVLKAEHRANSQARISAALATARRDGVLIDFPFGADYSEEERMLMPALSAIKAGARSPQRMAKLLLAGCLSAPETPGTIAALKRLNLHAPRRFSERVLALLVRGALNLTG